MKVASYEICVDKPSEYYAAEILYLLAFSFYVSIGAYVFMYFFYNFENDSPSGGYEVYDKPIHADKFEEGLRLVSSNERTLQRSENIYSVMEISNPNGSARPDQHHSNHKSEKNLIQLKTCINLLVSEVLNVIDCERVDTGDDKDSNESYLSTLHERIQILKIEAMNAGLLPQS